MGEMINTYRILARKPDRKRPLRRPRCRWGDIRTDLMGKKGGKLWIGCIWLRIG